MSTPTSTHTPMSTPTESSTVAAAAAAAAAKLSPSSDIHAVYEHLLCTAGTPATLARRTSVPFRKAQLAALARLMRENRADLQHALLLDLQKSPHESEITELAPVVNEIATAVSCLDAWTRPTRTPRMLALTYAECMVAPVARGLVLIIGPWNYPIHLLLAPLVSAIAAGNSVIMKASEQAPHASAVIARLLPRYLDNDLYAVIQGGVSETQELLKLRFDHIFFTGSTRVGKIVMAAAASHLTSLTLELGGKCPVIVHDPDENGGSSIDMRAVARRIAWGKFLNVGQTCIAPDYVICPTHRQEELAHYLAEAVHEFYGPNPLECTDYGRIINKAHFDRLRELMVAAEGFDDSGNSSSPGLITKPPIGGLSQCVAEQRYIPPTVYTQVASDSPLIDGGEIFGPLLPILALDTSKIDAVASQTMRTGNPLAIYVFTKDEKYAQALACATRSGSFVINDTVIQVAAEGMPFGGVGSSGMGSYHGKYGFDAFSHMRPIINRGLGFEALNSLRYPPYSNRKTSMTRKLVFYDI